MSGHEASFGSQPIANNACSLLVIVRPGFRETIVGDFVALYAEGVLDDPRGRAAVVAVDCLSRRLAIRVLLEVAWTYADKSLAEARSNSRPRRWRHFKRPITPTNYDAAWDRWYALSGDVSATEPAPARERCVPLTLRRGPLRLFARILPYHQYPIPQPEPLPQGALSTRIYRSTGLLLSRTMERDEALTLIASC